MSSRTRGPTFGILTVSGVERGLVLPNYGIPVQSQPFSLNSLVLDSIQSSDRLVGGIWVSFLPQNKEMTLGRVKAARASRASSPSRRPSCSAETPTPAPGTTTPVRSRRPALPRLRSTTWSFTSTPAQAVSSDINNFIPLVEKYGKRIKIYLVHFGGGVSGHIKLVPQFLDWVEQGFRVYCDTTWTIGFGARWLMTEIERRGIGEDRVLFASDEPWSDFWGEYWKINGAPVSQELKERVLYQNYEALYGGRG